jgi:carbonic anhydrase
LTTYQKKKKKKECDVTLCLTYFPSVFWRWVGSEGTDVHETPFSYTEGSGTGPEDWGKLNPDWIACGNGTMQSPIDIQQVQVSPTLGELETDYEPAPAKLVNKGHDIAVSCCCFSLYIVILFL